MSEDRHITSAPCSHCNQRFACFRLQEENYCLKCATRSKLLARITPVPAGPRTPIYRKDTAEAKRLTLMLIRVIAAEDAVPVKVPTYWATHVYRSMKEFTMQLLVQTDLLPMVKWTRLGIRTVPKKAADFTYPCLDKNEDWLRTTAVCFAPLPPHIYQSQVVSDLPDRDFEPRFNPGHIYPFRMITFRTDSAELILNPGLVTRQAPPEPVGWQKFSQAVKRPRHSGTRCRILEGLVTVDSSSMKPPIQHNQSYVVRELGVVPGLATVLEGRDVSLRLDRARLEAEERPEYLMQMNEMRKNGVKPPERALNPVLELARDLDLDSLTTESTPVLDFSDLLTYYQSAYLSELAAALHNLLLETVLSRKADIRVVRSKSYQRGTSLVLRLDSMPHVSLSTLYVVELRNPVESPLVVCGVTLLSTESQPIMVINQKKMCKIEGRIDADMWEIVNLERYQAEYESLKKGVDHLDRQDCRATLGTEKPLQG